MLSIYVTNASQQVHLEGACVGLPVRAGDARCRYVNAMVALTLVRIYRVGIRVYIGRRRSRYADPNISIFADRPGAVCCLPVPELTRSADIKLNARVSLRDRPSRR
jgi:hypothetical protein